MITGVLHFSRKKITLIDRDQTEYFVRRYSGAHGYIDGDVVEARFVRPASHGYQAEVTLKKLLTRSPHTLIAEITNISSRGIFATIDPSLGSLHPIRVESHTPVASHDIVTIRYEEKRAWWRVVQRVALSHDPEKEEKKILTLSGIQTEFSPWVLRESQWITGPLLENAWASIVPALFFSWLSEPLLLPTRAIQKKWDTPQIRTDFRDWFTMTIDSRDAKDLDDAISIARYDDGGYLLGVHIADVAEYVHENSPLDREARERTTSIYTPDKVIPMLPKSLSDDLCSLHPGSPKLTLSLLIRLTKEARVIDTFLTEWIIESKCQGVYEDIEREKNSSEPSDFLHFFALYRALAKRRKKEGKILFISTEPVFSLDTTGKVVDIQKRERLDAHMLIEEYMVLANEEVAKWCDKHGIPFLSRAHGEPPEVHQPLIREIIGVQKWTKLIPSHIRSFLDALHEQKYSHNSKKTENHSPTMSHDTRDTESALYLHSRLLLPKMAKAHYTDTLVSHFWLALSYYAHFTSPIRRYPDLIVHRIIKESLHGRLSNIRKSHYRAILKNIAKKCNNGEILASDVEHAINTVKMIEYMSDTVWEQYMWRISGITEWAIFVELDNAVEVTIALTPMTKQRKHQKYTKRINKSESWHTHILTLPDTWARPTLDPRNGILMYGQRRIAQIGERVRVEITRIDSWEKRIFGNILLTPSEISWEGQREA